jgi:hypothetical protein
MNWMNSAAFLTVALTGMYVYLSKRLLDEARHQRAPLISIHVATDPLYFGLLHLVVENVGRGAAYQVTIGVEGPEPSAVAERVKKLGAVEHGITYMAPGQRFSSFIANTFEPGGVWRSAFQLNCKYQDSDGKTHQSSCPLDLRMYDGLQVMKGPDDQARMAQALEKIEAHLKSLDASRSR